MAVSFPSTNLTPQNEREFVTDLCIQPKKHGKPDGKSYKTFWSDGKNVVMPFRYGHMFAKKYQIDLNPSGPYKETSYDFIGELRDFQIAGLELVKEHLEEFSTSTVCFHPGAGKTVIGTTLAYMTNLRALVAIHRKPLAKQWATTISTFTNAKYHIFGEKKNKTPLHEADIIICMDGSFHKIPEDILRSIGLLLVDEGHCFCTIDRSSALLYFRPRYVVALTATPDRKDGQSAFLLNMVGDHRILRPFKKPFNVVCRRTGIEPEQTSNAAGTLDWTVYTKSLMENDLRNYMILSDVLRNPDRKILILTKEKSHVDRLYELISPHVKTATMMGNQVTYEDSPVLIGTCSKINVGFDAATNAEEYDGRPIDMVIMCGSYADENVICQSAGRGLRAEDPLFIYYLDDANVAKNHWRIFRQWAVKCTGKITYEDVDKKALIIDIKAGKFNVKIKVPSKVIESKEDEGGKEAE